MKNHILPTLCAVFVFISMAFIATEQSKPPKYVMWIDLPEGIGRVHPGDTLGVYVNDTTFEVTFYKGTGKFMIVR